MVYLNTLLYPNTGRNFKALDVDESSYETNTQRGPTILRWVACYIAGAKRRQNNYMFEKLLTIIVRGLATTLDRL